MSENRSAPDLEPDAYTPEDLLGPLNEVEHLNAPKLLYVRGRKELLKKSPRISVVGARKATDLGLRRARKVSRSLAENGVAVVSGLAEGIDTAAHLAAMEVRGETIGVLGTPLDRVYPPENVGLQQRIGDEYLLVSQFPKGHPIRKWTFPARNRTMALIVNASVIVEASDTSGSLSQGWEALRLGRTLFIMKSILENPRLRWPHQMIEYGALVFSEVGEILEFLPGSDLTPADVAF